MSVETTTTYRSLPKRSPFRLRKQLRVGTLGSNGQSGPTPPTTPTEENLVREVTIGRLWPPRRRR